MTFPTVLADHTEAKAIEAGEGEGKAPPPTITKNKATPGKVFNYSM